MNSFIMVVCRIFQSVLNRFNELFNYHEDDPLHFILLLTIYPMKIRLVYIVIVSCLIYHLGLLLVQVVYFYFNFDKRLFIQYFSLNTGSTHACMAIFMSLLYYKNGVDAVIYQKKYFIRISRVREEIQERIMKIAVFRRNMILLSLVAAYCFILSFYPIFGYEDEYYFPIFFFDEYLGDYLGPFRFIIFFLKVAYYSSFIEFVMVSVLQVVITVYWFSHIQFQLIILEDELKKVENDFSIIKDTSTLDDEHYQAQIHDRLKRIIEHYHRVKRSVLSMQSWMFWPMMITFVGSFMHLASYVYFVIAQAVSEAYLRIVSEGIVNVSCIIMYALSGQGIIDQSEQLNESIYNLPWYNFDKRNRETLRIFSSYTKEPIKFKLMDLFQIDFSLILRVYKFVYSSLAIIQQVVAARHSEN